MHRIENQSLSRIAVTRESAALLLEISPSTFDNWIKLGLMPCGSKVRGLRRWDVAEIMACWQALKEGNAEGQSNEKDNPFDKTIG
ncbi:helix-turn-helix transcriptional regulator [Pseudovibrio exalbescens]|uniref:helix-turn-helix transcriptional regulator n=1 Tax=Pseudovibrio exalbescens TaxID=197461 RepID=UPI000C9B0D7E|nr:DNA-binding protein [Pseudovibrio exalbescens]